MTTDFVECPFCKDGDFDLIGLRHHLTCGYCEVFENTMTLTEERAQKVKER